MITQCLFFPEIATYKALLDETRWDTLIEQFRQENYRLFQLASQSVFTVALQAGLSALKTPYPFKCNVDNISFCWVHDEITKQNSNHYDTFKHCIFFFTPILCFYCLHF